MPLPCRVVKVGGSLFDLPELPRRLSRWLATETPAWNVLIAGGGPFCDAIREADTRFGLGELASHWLCIRALDTSAALLAALLGCEEISSWKEIVARCSQSSGTGAVVFNAADFLVHEEGRLPGTPLPHGWETTTDSIAARIAELLAAEELVLLKSSDPGGRSLEALAAEGYVDQVFPQAAKPCSAIRFVNLRSTGKDSGQPSE